MFGFGIDDPFSFAQILGYVAGVLGVLAFQTKNDTRMKITVCCSSVFMISHYFLIGAQAAAFVALLAASRWFLSIFSSVRQYARFLVPLYIGLFILIAFLTYERWFDLLPVISCIAGTFALFYFSGLRFRFIMLGATTLWVIHNALAQSYGSFVMELFLFVSNGSMIIRMILDHKKEPLSPEDSDSLNPTI